MAVTTFATAWSLTKQYVNQELIYNWFVKPDPIVALIPMVTASGREWLQEITSEPGGAAAKSYGDAMTGSALTVYNYKAFLNQIYKKDTRLMIEDALPAGQSGHSSRLIKRDHIWAAVAKKFREYLMVGQPATVAIGADLLAVLGASGAVECGPRIFDQDDVHYNTGGSVSTVYGYIKWVDATKVISYSTDGTNYGPAVTLSATNRWRVPLTDADGLKWIYVTATWATIDAAGNFTSDGTAAKGLTFTPSKQMTGLGIQAHPDNVNFGNLSKGGTWSSGYTTCNPTTTGDALSQTNLAWLKKKLLNASGGDPSRCAIVMSETEYLKAEVLLAALGAGGNRAVEFMGSEFNGLSFGGIPIVDNPFVVHTQGNAAGSANNLTTVYGLVLGQGNCHVKYASVGDDIAAGAGVAQQQTGGTGNDGTPGGTPVPMYYREIGENGSTEEISMVGTLTAEPVAATLDSVFQLRDIT